MAYKHSMMSALGIVLFTLSACTFALSNVSHALLPSIALGITGVTLAYKEYSSPQSRPLFLVMVGMSLTVANLFYSLTTPPVMWLPAIIIANIGMLATLSLSTNYAYYRSKDEAAARTALHRELCVSEPSTP